jgi:hypothetical protein
MVDGRQRDQWLHTCEVIAMIANTVRDKKKRRKPFRGADLYPYTDRSKTRTKPKEKAEAADIKTILNMYPGLPRGGAKRKEPIPGSEHVVFERRIDYRGEGE